MKKILTVSLTVIFVFSLVFCSGGSSISQEQAEETFALTLGATLVALFSSAFGESVEGVSFDEEKNEIVFNKFDLSEFSTDYTSMSGKSVSENGEMKVELTLAGGPAKKISYEVEDLDAQTFEADVTVDGKKYSIKLSKDDLQ